MKFKKTFRSLESLIQKENRGFTINSLPKAKKNLSLKIYIKHVGILGITKG